jgi:5-methylcytosine-specific restriction endonuclease McrA
VCNDVLDLTVEMETNYHALVNFLSGVSVRKNAGSRRACRVKNKTAELKQQNFSCLDCGFVFLQDSDGYYHTATVDHIIPWRYGSNVRMNREWVCRSCNNKRELNRMEHIIRVFGLEILNI